MGDVIELPKRREPQTLYGHGMPAHDFGEDGDQYVNFDALVDPTEPFVWRKADCLWMPDTGLTARENHCDEARVLRFPGSA